MLKQLQRPALILGVAAALAACADVPTGLVAAEDAALMSKSGKRASGETIYGLTAGNGLITFNSDKSNQSSNVVTITGLMAGETVVGIDFRPSDLTPANGSNVGTLYAVTSASRIYIVDPATGVATAPVALRLPGTSTPVALMGSSFGVGFNPTVDRLRVHSDADQNLRINVETGETIVDGTLSYTAGDRNAGRNPDVTATAYTNNDADASTGTELYGIDVAQDVLVEFGVANGSISGPNSGKLVTVGSLGVDAGMLAGFDISNASGIAYAVLGTSPSRKSTLYRIDLETGAATSLGMLAQTKSPLLGIALKP